MTGKELKTKLRKACKDKGITLTAVAAKLGMHRQVLEERLQVKVVSTSTLELLAEAIGESVSYFYNELPIFSVEEYVEVKSQQKEITYLRLLLAEKDARINELLAKSWQEKNKNSAK